MFLDSLPRFTWVEQSTGQGEEEESSQLYDLATLILEECKDAALLSNLDTVIYFFRKAPNSRKDLAGALVTRFSLTNQPHDLDEAVSLYLELGNDVLPRMLKAAKQQPDVCAQYWSDHQVCIYHFHRCVSWTT